MADSDITPIPEQEIAGTEANLLAGSLYLKIEYSNYIIFGASAMALLWAAYNTYVIN